MVNMVTIVSFLFLTLTSAQDSVAAKDVFHLTKCGNALIGDENGNTIVTNEILYYADRGTVGGGNMPTYNVTLAQKSLWRNRTTTAELNGAKFAVTLGIDAELLAGSAEYYDIKDCNGPGTVGYHKYDCFISNWRGDEKDIWLKGGSEMSLRTWAGSCGSLFECKGTGATGCGSAPA